MEPSINPPQIFCNLKGINYAPSVRILTIEGKRYFELNGPIYTCNRAALDIVFIIEIDVETVYLEADLEDFYLTEAPPIISMQIKSGKRQWAESYKGKPSRVTVW